MRHSQKTIYYHIFLLIPPFSFFLFFFINCLKQILRQTNILAFSKYLDNYSSDFNQIFRYYFFHHTDDLPELCEVGKLIRRYKENKQLVENVPSRFYEIIYPVQVRHHQKLGISTRDANDRSGKHFSETSLLIKAFSHKLRLDLELNTFLIGPQLIQKHFLPGDAQQISSQEIEHCYYHAKIKDHPTGIAAFRTCSGVSGVIHLGNETFVIQPFIGGDLSVSNSAYHEWSYAHYRPQRFQQQIRSKRDVREVTKYIELALILDKKMFDIRNASRLEVVNDAIQICNIADMSLMQGNTGLPTLEESWGWHMSVVGDQNMQPYRFSDCSLNTYIETLRKGNGICLFNKPHELEDFNSCGNGIIEGDEKCDCGSQKECLEKDPCCEGITCQLKKESECASGPCCDRCQLRKAGYPCRIAGDNECDIPEFCDGFLGQCPVDSHKRNGEECSKGRGYCFNGKCPTRDERCIEIWGYDSMSSEEKCYERFNLEGTLTGNFNLFIIPFRNLYCGTLHCMEGSLTPMIRNMTLFSRTIIAIRGKEYECKVASGNFSGKLGDYGMVPNGAKCGDRMICHEKECKSIESFIPEGSCPTNNVALVCSGNGICSNNNTCFCNEGWTSEQCNALRTDFSSSSGIEPTEIIHVLLPSPTTLTHLSKFYLKCDAAGGVGNVSLIIIFVSAVAAVFFFFALVAICYRRKAVRPKKGGGSPYSIKSLNGDADNSKMENCKDGGDIESMENSRIITFGNMPSYRDDKMELKRQRMRQQRQGSRESTDGSQQDEEIVSFIELPPNNLSKMSDKKGILKPKKGDKDRWDEPSESDNQDIGSQSDNNRGSDGFTDVETSLKSLTGYHEDILEALRNVAARSGNSYSSLSDELRKSLLSSDCFSDFDPSTLFKTSPENIPSSTSNEDLAAMASAADSVPPCGPIRIRSLEDVIRQLERHNPQIPASNRHLSPSGSEDVRMSETEADRHYHTLDGRGSGAAVKSRGGESQGPSRSLHFKFGGSKSKLKRPVSGTSSSDQPTQSTNSESAESSHGATTYLDDESENDECIANFLEDQLMRSASEEAFPMAQKSPYSYQSNMNYKQPHQKTLKLETCDYFPSPPSESSYTSSATQENGPFPPPPPPPPLLTNGNSLSRSGQHHSTLSTAPSSSTKNVSSTGAKGKKNKKFPEYKH
ncbi:Disintegrin and metalloproteinase domain-containing protein 22 [Nymphon striatum]|nr:Disintegrin and metalloproteinase domain-containing protein 22 [Nymphon striatum]